MPLTDQALPFGKVQALFSCPDCGNAREFGLVREERDGMAQGGCQDPLIAKVTV